MRSATFLITLIVIISSFIIIPNSTLGTASAAQLTYSDTAHENATVSYYNTSTTSPSATTLTFQPSANTTATDLAINLGSWTMNSAGTEAWQNITSGNPIGFYVASGTRISLNATEFEEGSFHYDSNTWGSIGTVYMTVTVGSTQMTAFHTYDVATEGNIYFITFAPCITSSVSGEITSLSFYATYYYQAWGIAPDYLETEVIYQGNTTQTALASDVASIPFVYGYHYQDAVSSSFSSQIPPYFASFKIYWSAQYPTEAIYPYTYPITINNPPSGSGYYQQLFTFSNPSQYGINSAGSNILFSLSNGTNLYAWIQSINSTSMNVWVKVPYGTSTVNLNVYPQFENLLSSTGYLGEAPQLSSPYNASNNAFLVFGMGYFFTGTTLNPLLVVTSGTTISQDNGLTISTNSTTYLGAYLNVNYNASKYELVYNAYYSGTSTTPPSIIGPILGFGTTGSAGGLSEGDNEYQAVAYNGTNHESSPIPMSTTSYNNFIYWLSGTTVNIQYNGITYSVGGNYPYSVNGSYPFELYTYDNTLHINYIIPVVKLPNGMPTYSIGSPVSPTTSSPITGIIGQYGISFAPTTQDIPVTSYTVTYNITFVATRPNSATETSTTSYSITQATDGIYFNASFSFSWSFSNPTLYVSSSYPISWYINVSHLLDEYPSYTSNTINFGVSPANYSRATYGSDSTQYFDFIYYYNSTSSSADSVTFTVTTSELVNNYPTITYASLKYSGHGSTEVLTVNASNPFKNETLQLTNVNWGDGSPTQSSPVETPVDKNYYNFTLTHQYNTTGTFTVTLLVVNAVGNSASLSSSAHGSISLSITINYTSNALPVKTNTRIFFNYTQINVNVQNVYLYINNILVQANNTTSNTNYNGAVSYVIPYYLTQTAEFDAKWLWTAGGISGSQVIQYSVANSVPTVGTWVIVNYTIGTGSTATKESIPYFYTQRIPFNFTWSYYVWQILLPPNSVNITVKGNPQWKDPIISVPANYYANISTFALLVSTSEFQVTWLAPNPIGNALIIIEYYPESAIFGEFGVNIPFNTFDTYLNGKQIYSPTQQVNIGESIVINTTTVYGTLISSYSTTVSEQTQFIEIPLNIVPLTIDNMNSSYVIGMKVTAHNVTQTGQYLMPLQSQVFYVPAGTYVFSFTYLNFNSYSVVKYLNISATISGVSYYIITGVTLTQINYNVQQTQHNITNLVENVNITLSNSNSKIYNETLIIKSDLTNTNSSIIKQVLDENTTISNIHSIVQQIQSDVYAIQNNILSQINSTALSVTTKETTIKDLVSLSLQEENATFSYQLRFGTPSVSGTTYQFPVFVSLFNGQMANLSVTQQAWQNMRLYYVSGNQSVPLNFSVTNVKPGSFIVQIYNITPAMASSISSGDSLIAAQGEVKEGVLTNLAAGIIGSQQIQYSSNNLWTEIFGLSPPKGNASINGMFEYLSWLGESYAGRAIYLIVILAALAYYVTMINSKLNERRKKK
ncbi:MAG: hypothetical protein QXV17_08870 [Candidatus Micrarchaeaceae archaeon]